MAKEDLYSILGISRNAKDDEVKKAYRRLARKNHPDVNPGDKGAEERFKRVQEAYDILSDPKKRAIYDQYGFYSDNIKERAGEPGYGFSGEPWRGFDFSGIDFSGTGDDSFQDIFSDLFGSSVRGRPTGPERGADLEQHLNISFRESLVGLTTRLMITRQETCESCGGSGLNRSKGQQVCPNCQGTGKESKLRGVMRFSGPCRTCGGAGRVGGTCDQCRGSGTTPGQQTITVRIPAGVDTGYRMRVPGKGNGGRLGGPAGDLFLIVTVRPDDIFSRQGMDITCTVPITVTEAALGAKIEVPTMQGKTILRIPPGTQSGQKFRLREKGAPSLRGEGKGNLIIEVHVVVPRVADERSKEILRELARLNPDNPRARLLLD